MNLKEIVDSVAGRADDFLADAANAKEARNAIGELLGAEFPKLSGSDRLKITDSVIAILLEEGFFEGTQRGGDWDDASDSPDEE